MGFLITSLVIFGVIYIFAKAFQKDTSETTVTREDENGNKVTETIVTHHDSAGKTAAQGTVGCLLVIVAIIVFFILFIISKA